MSKFGEISCVVPFSSFHIYGDGRVINCCPTWLTTYIGNVRKNTLLELLRSEVARKIQKSVLDGSFSFCEKALCPHLARFDSQGVVLNPLMAKSDAGEYLEYASANFLPKKVDIFLDYDRSCNLHCPSCRNERHLLKKENLPADVLDIHNRTLRSIEEFLEKGVAVNLNVTGAGDPFASPLYWDLLKNLEVKDGLTVTLQTNGVLMTEDRLQYPFVQVLNYANISVDAATEDTYNLVRPGGSFTKLQRNISYFDDLIFNHRMPHFMGWQLNFVVQSANFREIVPFAEWAMGLKTPSVWYNLIADWGHLPRNKFREKAIWEENHPQHYEFLKVLNNPILQSERIHLGNMSPLFFESLGKF